PRRRFDRDSGGEHPPEVRDRDQEKQEDGRDQHEFRGRLAPCRPDRPATTSNECEAPPGAHDRCPALPIPEWAPGCAALSEPRVRSFASPTAPSAVSSPTPVSECPAIARTAERRRPRPTQGVV